MAKIKLPTDDSFYIRCKNEKQRDVICGYLLGDGYKNITSRPFRDFPNIMVQQSGIFADARGGKYFAHWSLSLEGPNIPAYPIYEAKNIM